MKASDGVKDRESLICEIIEIVKMMSIGIYFQYADRCKKRRKMILLL